MPVPLAVIHLAQRRRSALSGRQVEAHIEVIAALPVTVDRRIAEYVGLDGRRQSEQGKQRRLVPPIDARLLVPGDDRVAFYCQLLRTKEHLRSAQNKGIVAIVQRISDKQFLRPSQRLVAINRHFINSRFVIRDLKSRIKNQES